MSRLSRRRTVGAALAIAAVTAIPGPSVAQDPVELTFSLWAYQDDIGAAYDEFIAAYLAQEPRVSKINILAQPFVRYHDVLNVQIAGGASPDTSWIAFNLAPVYIDSGGLMDLKPTLEALPDYDYADLRPSSLEPWARGESVYGIPFTNSTNVVYYNTDILTAAGVKTPDEMVADGEWTWENLKASAKQIVDSGSARHGMVFGNLIFTNGWRILEDIWAPYGGAPWSEDGKTCLFNAPETVAATQLVWDMIYTDKSHPEPGVDADFFAGDIGMGLYRPSAAPRLEEVDWGWGIAPQPSGPAGYVPAAATNGITVLTGSANPDLAAEFLAFTTNVENSKRMSRNFPSARQSLQTVEVLSEVNPVISPEDIETTILAAITHPDASWGYSHVQWGPLQTNAQRVFDGMIWNAEADVQAGLDQVCADITPLLGP